MVGRRTATHIVPYGPAWHLAVLTRSGQVTVTVVDHASERDPSTTTWRLVIVTIGDHEIDRAVRWLLMRRFHSFSYLGATMNQSVLLLPFFLVACAASPDDAPANEDDALVNAPVDTKNAWSVGVCASEPNSDPAKGPIGACVE